MTTKKDGLVALTEEEARYAVIAHVKTLSDDVTATHNDELVRVFNWDTCRLVAQGTTWAVVAVKLGLSR